MTRSRMSSATVRSPASRSIATSPSWPRRTATPPTLPIALRPATSKASSGQVVQGSPKYRERLEQNRDALDAMSLDTCGIGNYMLCMKSNGEFLPCPGFGLVVGNAWDSDIGEVWRNSPSLAALRRFSRREQFPAMHLVRGDRLLQLLPGEVPQRGRLGVGRHPSRLLRDCPNQQADGTAALRVSALTKPRGTRSWVSS